MLFRGSPRAARWRHSSVGQSIRFIPEVSPVRIQVPLPDQGRRRSACAFLIRPVGQVVKTPPFHGGNMGSSPVRVTIREVLPKGGASFLFFARPSPPSLCRSFGPSSNRPVRQRGGSRVKKELQHSCRSSFHFVQVLARSCSLDQVFAGFLSFLFSQ